jgi:hypothetical protein
VLDPGRRGEPGGSDVVRRAAPFAHQVSGGLVLAQELLDMPLNFLAQAFSRLRAGEFVVEVIEFLVSAPSIVRAVDAPGATQATRYRPR